MRALRTVLALEIAFWLVIVVVSCVHPAASGARVAGALDLLARVIDPAYGFAVSSCLSAEDAIATSVEAHRTSSEDGAAELARVRAGCDVVRDQFERVRLLHALASSLIERGAVDDAAHVLEQIEAAWSAMPPALERDGGPP